jgi:hypothetical protein
VEDAWQTDLESHVDFDGWHYLSRNSNSDPTKIDDDKPVVYFGSFQDLLGRDATGNIKPSNEWLHAVNWDLVVFDGKRRTEHGEGWARPQVILSRESGPPANDDKRGQNPRPVSAKNADTRTGHPSGL